LLPAIPEKLWAIDEVTASEHFSLTGADRCYYIWEYAARRRYDFSPANQLVMNLKIKPSAITRAPARAAHKQRAIEHAAAALRCLIPRQFVAERATFVPVPCSKVAGDADHDDRLLRVLAHAFRDWPADVRDLLRLTRSTPADHAAEDRLSFDELLALTCLTDAAATPARPVIVIVDDVLNSGKHFKVAQALLAASFPAAELRGLFLARCVRGPV